VSRRTSRERAFTAGTFALGAGLALSGASRAARATYSIVAADTRTHRTGGAGTSCLEGQDVFIIHGVVPGIGTIHAQATYNAAARERGVELLRAGETPRDIVAALTLPSFDASASFRQYGVVTTLGDVAAYTGADDGTFAGDRQGTVGTLAYSVQGNILTSRAVIDHAADAFEAAGCDLPERLMRALEAGALSGEGDRRCTTTRGIPSDSAFLRVSAGDGDDDPYLDLRVPTSGDDSPLVGLRAQLDRWRAEHPCGEAKSGAGGGPVGDGPKPSDGGCGCHLPRGRTGTAPLGWLAFTLGSLAARRRRPYVRRVPGALSRQ
jgi:uncharacterized Ntn-hydrolase superfamily protein